MFKGFRFQIALLFVCLSFAVYVAFAVIGGVFFYNSLTSSIDEELKVVASQIGHAIDLNNETPTFRDWIRVVETEPARSLVSIQLYDFNGKLLERFGPPGIKQLIPSSHEFSDQNIHMRIRCSPLLHQKRIVGYLQLELPTTNREQSSREFLITLSKMAPLVLLCFGIIGYLVSGIAVRPIESLVSSLQRFVADAGHELNTPTSIVQARAQSLERKLNNQKNVQEDIDTIISSAERMGVIVSGLMLLAELDSRNTFKTLKSIDLKDAIELSLRDFNARFGIKQIVLQTSQLESAIIQADQEAIQRLICNLLENAHKYTQGPGTVTVSCTNRGTEAHLSVQDTGIGIPEESLPYIFDRFYRVDRSRSRESGGSGLGLSIVEAIVKNLGGRVKVESKLGEGSQFHIFLPLSRSSQTAAKSS